MTQITSQIATELAAIASRAQMPVDHVQKVFSQILNDAVFTPDMILGGLDWFYNQLGLNTYYFQTTPPEIIASHIQSLFAGRILSKTTGENVGLRLQSESPSGAMFVCREDHAVAIEIERQLEEKYPTHRLQSYRTTGNVSDESNIRLRMYFLSAPNFVNPKAGEQSTDLSQISSQDFINNTLPQTLERYQRLIRHAINSLGPVIEVSEKPDTKETRIMVAYRRGVTHSYFSAISDVLNSYQIHSNRKYIEHFANGLVVYSIYVDHNFTAETLDNIREDISLAALLPQTSLTPLFREGKMNMQEVVYAYAAWKFVHQFLSRYSEKYTVLSKALQDNPTNLGILNEMKTRLSKDTFTEGRIFDTIFAYPDLLKELYKDFARHHFIKGGQKPKSPQLEKNLALQQKITKDVTSEIDQRILSAFLMFNQHVLKTNFYKDTKTALAFRMDPTFLSKTDYPDTPFGIFFVVGSEFRGFHIRFRDVARGGIRIINSPNPEAYTHNVESLFDENYRLAHTQQRKNKDIPEGGSKGVLLLSRPYQDRTEFSFKKYVDGLLDMLMPNEEIADHYGKEEILFLGPDEGTAELVDWASLHARQRGYRFWKSFTTGKSVEHGGIPHDRYGMTTRGVHQYVLGILEKEGLQEENVTKCQTGGPDGDLGSNEILLSKDKTLSIVDGSGVLYDPEGIHRQELTRLATARKMVRHFDKSKLSGKGFLVTIEDRDITLPDGTFVESGLQFRNQYHLSSYSSAVLFVPCGGRPSSVHINNVDKLFDDKGKPRFKYVVEGANLFLTQEARIALEKQGVIIYKDASANKGGVTSSSMEVLAALSLNDEEFAKHAVVRGEQVPEFYRNYIPEVHRRIEDNARLEFDVIWREHQRTGKFRSDISDELSNKINELNDRIQESTLWDNQTLRRNVLTDYCPKVLLNLLGLDTILKRVPQNYLRAIFGAQLASRYVYEYGLDANEVAFFEFIHKILHK